jgi:hypothetical protein
MSDRSNAMYARYLAHIQQLQPISMIPSSRMQVSNGGYK